MRLKVVRRQTAHRLVLRNMQQLLRQLHARFAIIVIFTQPDDNFPRALEDLAHQLYLRIPLLDALLADADLVDP